MQYNRVKMFQWKIKNRRVSSATLGVCTYCQWHFIQYDGASNAHTSFNPLQYPILTNILIKYLIHREVQFHSVQQ